MITKAGKVNVDFSAVKRKHFRDQKWYDFNYFICNWFTDLHGKIMIEHWVEYDGGTSGSITINGSYPSSCAGCPSTSYSYSIKKDSNDDDLGSAFISFYDSKLQIYNISYANIKRK
ncbi:MAG: hypothetical protein IPH58_03310 [Sphingobacteriales bacterium]|nr:hypothetical protein [Sphingobacteriales bacterium]